MKKIFAMFMCLCMLLSAVPVFADNVAVADAKVCQVLLDEDFEGETLTNFTMEETSGAVGAVNAVAETDAYGMGQNNYSITNAGTSPYGKIVFDTVNPMTESLRAGAHKEDSATYGYTVEISMDWNPFDYNTTNSSNYLSIRGREKKETGFSLGQFMYLQYVGGDAKDSGRKMTVCDRGMVAVETIDLTTVLGDDIWNTEHVYRVRFVIKPYTAVVEKDGAKYAGTIDIYVDGVMLTTFEYKDNTKETHVYGLGYRTNKEFASYIDNVKMVAYWDALNAEAEGAVAYVNDDELVTLIRHCEGELTNLDADKQAVLSEAIASAKAVVEAADKTQKAVDEATAMLEETEKEVFKVYQYNVLYSENFEGTEFNGFNAYSADETNNGGCVVVDTSDYGVGNSWYSLQASGKYGVIQQFTTASAKIQGNATNIANNYRTELSFDYKMPENIASYILINANNGSGEFQRSGKIFQLIMDSKEETAKLYNRNATNAGSLVATINLADFAKGATFEGNVNRFRFVFEPETVEEIDGVKYAGTLNLYINGIKACDAKYISNGKESAIAGMTVKTATGNAGAHLGYIDNIELIEYDDITCAVENSVAYANSDNLVAAIRGAESLKSVAEAESVEVPENLDALIAEAKAVCENAKATTETMNAKAEALNNSVITVKNALYSYSLIEDFAWVPNVAEASEKGKAQNSVYTDLYLPSNYITGDRALDITWQSDEPGVVDASGYVTGPVESTYVNLTAIFTDGTDNSIYAEKNFKVRVIAGGRVIFNQAVESADTTPQKTFAPTNKKFMLTVSGKAGDYTFKTGGKEVTYTFANDGDYDIIYDAEKDSYAIYENCVKVAEGSVELGTVKNATVTGKEITKFIGVDLNTEEAFISDYNYNDGTYDLGVPTPGSTLTGITLKARVDLQDVKLVAASYSADGKLLDVASEDVNADEGETIPITFEDGVSLPDAEGYDGAALKIFLWNAQLAPVMTPVIYSDLGAQYEDRATLYMIGDSTMCNYSESYYPRAGWGQMLGNYFDAEEVVVDNRAVSGRTTRWFKDKGEFDKILKVIKPGDYLIMQFGHNDQKEANNISLDEYKEYLKYFADSVEAKGAIPVICSSISRRYYNEETGLYDPTIGSLGEYPAAAMAVANELGITGLDLYGYSKTVLGNLSETASRQLYCFVPNDYPGFDETKLVKYADGAQDNTHFSEYGANIWAKEAARLISLTDLSIASSVTITE